MSANNDTVALRSEVILVFAMVLSIFLLTSAGFDTSEGRYHYMIAHQIVTKGSLGFAEPREGVFTVAPNGRTYASHEIGNTLFLLPVASVNAVIEKALAGRWDSRRVDYVTGFLVSLVPAFYCAVTVALLYALLRLVFNQAIGTALAGCLSLAFCTFVWTYSRNLFDGVLCMALLTGAMLSMMQFTRTRDKRLFLVATILLGLGVITRLSMVLAIVAFAVYLTIIFWKDRAQLMRLILVGAGLLTPFAIWQLYYNHLRTGYWLLAPAMTAQYAVNNSLRGDLVVGVTGYLFSPGKSIFLYFPLLLLSVVCFSRFMKAYPAEATFVAVLSALWLLLHAKLVSWFGAWGWGPRYFVTIAPVLALPACATWEWMKERLWRRSLLIGSLAWGALLSVSSIIGNWHFRMAFAHMQGREKAMIWSLTRGQAADMIASAAANLRNWLSGLPGPRVPPYSPANEYASNTINVWINSAAHQGIPRAFLAVAALALIAAALSSFAGLRRVASENS